MIRILLLPSGTGEQFSGADLSAIDLLDAIGSRWPVVGFAAAVPAGSSLGRLAAGQGIAPVGSVGPAVLLHRAGLREFLAAAIRLVRFCRADPVELLHANGWHWVDLLAVAGRVLRVPTVLHLRDAASALHQPTLRSPVRRFMARLIPQMVTISHYAAQTWRDRWPMQRLRVVPNGFRFPAAPRHQAAPSDRTRFLVVANVTPTKRLEDLEGFLRRWPAPWSLTIRGHLVTTGPDAEVARALTNRFENLGWAQRCRWLPFVPPGDHDIFKDHDILLHPCPEEAFGRVLIEGVIAGLLVVGANRGGCQEVLADGIGVTVDFSEPRSAVAAVIDAQARQVRDATLAGRRFELARNRYHLDRAAVLMQGIYRRSLGHRVTAQGRVGHVRSDAVLQPTTMTRVDPTGPPG